MSVETEKLIGQGTTPTLRLRYRWTESATNTLLFSLRQSGKTIISKTEADARWMDERILFTFTQAETLQLTPGPCYLQLRARLNNGTVLMLNGKDPLTVVEAFEKRVI